MRLIIKTQTRNTYFVHFPNYMDVGDVELLVEEAKESLPKGEKYKSHLVNSDDLCDEERKQLDYYGEIRYPLIPLKVDIYELE